MSSTQDYKRAGVDLEAAQQSVELLKPLAKQTERPGVMEGLGGFGALFSLAQAGYIDDPQRDLILVSSTDGVGTKLKIAIEVGEHDTIGVDCVAMCVNDIITTGAMPLFFLDYLATGVLDPAQVAQIVSGIARGCSESRCALIGGETAEMPGFYAKGDYDVAGFAVGIARAGELLSSRTVREGDVVLGLESSGVHSNGFSLVRKIIEDQGLALNAPHPALDSTASLGQQLLTPTRLYVEPLRWLFERVHVSRAAHITGGGLLENIPRVMPQGLGVRLWADRWSVPPVLALLCELGELPLEARYRVFNMGVGMILTSPTLPDNALIEEFRDVFGFELRVIGEVVSEPGVKIECGDGEIIG